ncbi:hypothetical protein ED28_17305 [[Pantoea] beijingensis]|uniref:AroM protein n=1 Tax=[Pantoea] beijingensis TaxID=1324864 RepID=A0A443I964_9GAMM|nr:MULTISPECIES: AroM family protein [Erwiniaceae]RWR00619.1 hypothetical protein ED28_17305 [[Pantoea] beijingensis]
MKHTLVTLTIGATPRNDILPLLLEYMTEEQIAHAALLEGLTATEIERQYAAEHHEKVLISHLPDGSQVLLSVAKVEAGLQRKIVELEAEGVETILLLCSNELSTLHARRAVLLEPDRLIPPLVKSIVEGHQVGIVVPMIEQIKQQSIKWKSLSRTPCFAVANPYHEDNDGLIDAALSLQEQGADVVVLDSLGYQQRHSDLLQKLLGIPVLLSNMLLVKLAAELLV